jgi:NADH:ubiquinone oxidoreductase subunit 3 (subunit A)
MDPVGILVSPPLAAVYAFVICWLLYAWSKTIAPPSAPSVNKAMPYVGGEAMEDRTCYPGYQFYSVALFFAIVHIAALIIAVAPPDAPLAGTLGYLAVMAVAVAVLRWEQ